MTVRISDVRTNWYRTLGLCPFGFRHSTVNQCIFVQHGDDVITERRDSGHAADRFPNAISDHTDSHPGRRRAESANISGWNISISGWNFNISGWNIKEPSCQNFSMKCLQMTSREFQQISLPSITSLCLAPCLVWPWILYCVDAEGEGKSIEI